MSLRVHIKHPNPKQTIALSFLAAIFIGSFLLYLPLSHTKGQTLSYIDSLYLSFSSICITGLSPINISAVLSPFGKFILGLLIQIGGLGITVLSTLVIMLVGKKIDLKNRTIVKETLNVDSGGGIVSFVQNVCITTLTIEIFTSWIFFCIFRSRYSNNYAFSKALFHTISSFNNAGFDIFEENASLSYFKNDVLFNILTCLLIVLGGLGFIVIREILHKGLKWKKYTMHTKVVLFSTLILILIPAILIKLIEHITPLGALFTSITTRTAGFYTFDINSFRPATLLLIIFLMFIGASPGGTAGGVKTTTLFIIIMGIKEIITNRKSKTFHYSLPKGSFKKASIIILLAAGLVLLFTFLLLITDTGLTFLEALFECTSSFGTVGLSLNVTARLSVEGKILSMILMFIGRLGPLTIATLGSFNKTDNVSYPEGNIMIG